ncbi:MAG: hypothetical protein K6T91_01625 [Firmicutes bacterium]|nr:hypothetical protein [Bacillota bacterium]
MVNESFRTGLSFGLTSGIITTLGLMVGLNAGTSSKMVVIGGILTIAIADAFSDALGIHISQESEAEHTAKEIWQATFATFLAKFAFASAFIIPVLLLPLVAAVIVSVFAGLVVLGIASFIIAKNEKEKPIKVIAEHLAVAIAVVIVANYVGEWISRVF